MTFYKTICIYRLTRIQVYNQYKQIVFDSTSVHRLRLLKKLYILGTPRTGSSRSLPAGNRRSPSSKSLGADRNARKLAALAVRKAIAETPSSSAMSMVQDTKPSAMTHVTAGSRRWGRRRHQKHGCRDSPWRGSEWWRHKQSAVRACGPTRQGLVELREVGRRAAVVVSGSPSGTDRKRRSSESVTPAEAAEVVFGAEEGDD
ncbi:unnamed protein product [Urochloa humidicola]